MLRDVWELSLSKQSKKNAWTVEEEKEANGDQGKLACDGAWHHASNPKMNYKFRLKSKQNLKDNFSTCNPSLVNKKEGEE